MFEGHDPGRDAIEAARRRLAAERLASAKAEKVVAEATVRKARADVDRAAAARSFREKTARRVRSLQEKGEVPAATFDEAEHRHQAAVTAERAAKAVLDAAEVQLKAASEAVDPVGGGRKDGDGPAVGR